jgi:elongator complex protein 1
MSVFNFSNEDVTQTLYKNMYKDVTKPKQDINNKINKICEHMIKILENLNCDKYYLTLLSCYAKKNQLDESLRIVRSTNNELKTEQGLRHLLYLADVNELFDIALGTYDFDVVIMVAEKSQKDPKEYLPFLNELKSFEENYRKYKIDFHLKRYKKALDSIVKCGMFYFLIFIHQKKIIRNEFLFYLS